MGEGGGERRREAGTSLVGLLLVVAILAGLAFLVVTSVDRDDRLAGTVAGVGPTGPGDPAVGGNLPDAASVAACRADAAVLEAAMAAAHAVGGSYPASLAELQSSGFVSDQSVRPGRNFAPEMVEGEATGRMLVDGRPADEGCH